MTYDPETRYRNLLIGLSRVIVSLERQSSEKQMQATYMGRKAAGQQNRLSGTLRKLLAHNGRACSYYFQSREPADIARHEIRQDTQQ